MGYTPSCQAWLHPITLAWWFMQPSGHPPHAFLVVLPLGKRKGRKVTVQLKDATRKLSPRLESGKGVLQYVAKKARSFVLGSDGWGNLGFGPSTQESPKQARQASVTQDDPVPKEQTGQACSSLLDLSRGKEGNRPPFPDPA